MSAPTCLCGCGRPLLDGYVTAPCMAKPRAQLAQIGDMAVAARDVAHRLSRTGSTEAGSGVPGSSLPLDLTATARLDGVSNALGGWLRHATEERGGTADVSHWPEPLEGIAVQLAGHLEWMRHRPEVDEFLADVATAARVIAGIARGPGELKYLGPCGATWDIGTLPEPEQTLTCDGDVYGRPDARTGYCRRCGAQVNQAERAVWLDEQVRDKAFRASEIAHAYDIPVKTIRGWATDRPEEVAPNGVVIRNARPAKLHMHGRDRIGRPLYLVGPVLDLWVQARKRKADSESRRAEQEVDREAHRVAKRESGSYMTVHQRLRRERGPANTHECAHCPQAAWDWAYDHQDPQEMASEMGPYSVKPEHYKPLCRPCHRAFDKTRGGKQLTG